MRTTENFRSDIAPGTVVAGKYRIGRVIGEGGMGQVVEATNIDLDELVALKFMRPAAATSPEHVARFSHEARAAVKLKSEHVARVFDVSVHEGVPFIVMELLQGNDLETIVAESGPLPIPQAVLYVVQACEGLAEAHARGLVHRDIKPANIFIVDRHGTRAAKILDFGIAKAANVPESARSLKDTSGIVGSPFYMAPEQFRTSKETKPSCDIWSLGVVLFEAITGRTPFDENLEFVDLMNAILSSPHRRMSEFRPDVRPELEEIVDWCLQKDPADRCPSAAELAIDLLPFAPSAARGAAERARAIAAGAGQLSRTEVSLPPSMPPPAADPRQSARRTVRSSSPSVTNDLPGAVTGARTAVTSDAPAAPPAKRAGAPLWTAGVVGLLLVVGGAALLLHRAKPGASPVTASVPSSVALAETAPSTVDTSQSPSETALVPGPHDVASGAVVPSRAPSTSLARTPPAMHRDPRAAGLASSGARTSPLATAASRPADTMSPALPPVVVAAKATSPSPTSNSVPIAPAVTVTPGTIEAKAVRATAQSHAPEVQACFDRAQLNTPDLNGRVAVRASVTPSGDVNDAAIASSTANNTQLESCIVRAFRSWKFPAPAGGVAGSVSYTFIFR